MTSRAGGARILRPFVDAVTSLDRSKLRPVSGLRRGMVVLVLMAVSWHWIGVAAAANVGVAALLVGLLDRQQSPRIVARTMSVGTVVMAVTSYVAHSLGSSSLVVLIVFATIAFWEGASIVLNRDAPIILHFAGLQAATVILDPGTSTPAVTAALTVLAAGAAQTLTTVASAYLTPAIREVERTAAELAVVAASLRRVANSPDPAALTVESEAESETALRQMSETQRYVAGSDLDPMEREALGQVLWSADRLRLEAKAYALARSTGRDPDSIDREAVRRDLGTAVGALESCAAALRARPADRDGAARALRTELGPAEGQGSGPATGSDFDQLIRALANSVVEFLRIPHGRGRPESRSQLLTHLKSSVKPGSLPFRLGTRLAVAAVLCVLVGAFAGLAHASWIVTSVLAVFRPDSSATLTRLVLRAVGVSVGAFLIVAIAWIPFDTRAILTVALGAFVLLVYWVGPANYALFGAFLSMSVLSVLAVTGADPEQMAMARWVDTLVGCAIALVVAFVMPVWQVTNLPGDVASLGRSVAAWFAAIATALDRPTEGRDLEGVRRQGTRARDAVCDVLTTLRLAEVEPRGRIPVARLRTVFQQMRAGARGALSVQHLLEHGAPRSGSSADLARRAATDLEDLARLALSQPTMPRKFDPGPTPTDEVGNVLATTCYRAEETLRRFGAYPAKSSR